MIPTHREGREARSVLERRGYSSAWVLSNLDESEVLFLVPREELDEPYDAESAVELGHVLLHRKIWVVQFKPTAAAVRFY